MQKIAPSVGKALASALTCYTAFYDLRLSFEFLVKAMYISILLTRSSSYPFWHPIHSFVPAVRAHFCEPAIYHLLIRDYYGAFNVAFICR